MGIIHETPEGVFIGDRSRPIEETARLKALFKDVRDASLATGISVKEIMEAVGSETVVKLKGFEFSWPTAKRVQREFPNYIIANFGGFQPAKPVTVHTRTPGASGKRDTINHRSITSVRDRYDLTPRQFDKIVNQEAGWQKLLPDHVTRFEIREPGWKPSDQVFVFGRRDKSAYFLLRQTAKGISITYQGPKLVGRARELPACIESNSEWKK